MCKEVKRTRKAIPLLMKIFLFSDSSLHRRSPIVYVHKLDAIQYRLKAPAKSQILTFFLPSSQQPPLSVDVTSPQSVLEWDHCDSRIYCDYQKNCNKKTQLTLSVSERIYLLSTIVTAHFHF